MNPGTILLLIFVFALAISSHESSHAYVADQCGDPTGKRAGRISLNPINHVDPFGTVVLPLLLILMNQPPFGYARPVPVNPSNLRDPRRDRALVSAAGPGANVLLAFASMFLSVILAPFLVTSTGEGLRRLLLYNTQINTLLAVFNLIPIPPLDGGGILQYFLPRRWVRMIDQNQFLLMVVLLLLMYSGGFGVVLYPFTRGIFQLQNFLVQLVW